MAKLYINDVGLEFDVNDPNQIIKALRLKADNIKAKADPELFIGAVHILQDLMSEMWAARNELCLRCGKYKTRHLGSCDGCRWRL